MPATSTVPMLLRASAPGPVTSTRGRWPKTVAADVISTGRSRVNDASRSAAPFARPRACRVFANCTIRIPFVALSPTSVISPTCEQMLLVEGCKQLEIGEPDGASGTQRDYAGTAD